MKNAFKSTLITAFALVCHLSFGQRSKADHSTNADFAKLSSYCLIEGKTVHFPDNVPSQQKAINKNIDSTIIAALNTKGFKKANSLNELDFVITYTVGVRAEIELEQLEGGIAQQFGYHASYSTRHHHWYQTSSIDWWNINKPTYTLVIDVYDGKTKQLIWRSHTEHLLKGKSANQMIALTTQKAIQSFPTHK